MNNSASRYFRSNIISEVNFCQRRCETSYILADDLYNPSGEVSYKLRDNFCHSSLGVSRALVDNLYCKNLLFSYFDVSARAHTHTHTHTHTHHS